MGNPALQVQTMALEEWGFVPPEGDIQGKLTTPGCVPSNFVANRRAPKLSLNNHAQSSKTM